MYPYVIRKRCELYGRRCRRVADHAPIFQGGHRVWDTGQRPRALELDDGTRIALPGDVLATANTKLGRAVIAKLRRLQIAQVPPDKYATLSDGVWKRI